MKSAVLFLADADTDVIVGSWRFMDPYARGGFIVIGAIGCVTLLILFWAMFFRKNGRRRRHHSHHHRHEQEPAPVAAPAVANNLDAPPPPERHHRRRHRRHRHRSRNPTLAETGGLPPIRSEGQPEAPP